MDKILKDVKTYIFLAVAIGAVVGFFQLPAKVRAVEEKTVEVDDKVQSLAGTVEKYIAVQEAKEEQQAQQRELLLELIERMVR